MEDVQNNQSNGNINNTVGAEPVYSQMSLEYVANQVSKAKRKGFLLGFLLTLGIVLLTGALYKGVSLVKMIANGTFYASAIGGMGGSLLDKDTVEKINSIYNIIDNTYIEEVDKDTLRQGMYKGILEALDDPYSVYYTKDEYDEMMEDSSGVFEGIGAYLTADPDTKAVKVVRPIKGSPAEAVGILAEDIIVEVDGEDVTGLDLDVVVSKVRGPKGTSVDVGIKRAGEINVIHFTIERASVNVESVEREMLDSNIGFIYITSFDSNTADQFEEAYDELKGDGMTSLIIDLRSNGGGYVDQSVDIADKLVKSGNIVSIKGKTGAGFSYDDKGDEEYIDIPCVVLVDANTASASEILTGALKDYKIATIIGTQTFGKGIVQDIIPMPDGSGIKVTSSKYYTPNGDNIHGIGIEPDIIVGFDADMYINEQVDNQLEAAKQYLLNGKIDDKYIPKMPEKE